MKYLILLALMLLTLLVLLTLLRWCLLPHSGLPRFRVRYMRLRLWLRLHPGRGHATVFELWLRWGRFAAFRRSRFSRRCLPAWQRATHPDEHSVRLGRAQLGHGLRIGLEEHVLVMAPPRTGKTALLAKIIMRYPGPVVSTTTKHDVFQLSSGVRFFLGPVHVFNPQNVGGVAPTFAWNPVDGCIDEPTAIRRADAFAHAVSLAGAEDASFWAGKASSYLRALFHAAALADGDMRTVAAWALGSSEDAEDILFRHGADGWALELAELRGEAQKTAQTVRMVISRALAFMNDPSLAASVLPGDQPAFGIEEFLLQRGTLYLIAESEYDDSPVAPLFACLAGEIHHIAAQIGQQMRGGRLDPPLLMALDEIVQTCPVPLPNWLADSGGKGIQLIPVAHGEAQLRTRWGRDGAQVVLDTCGVKAFLPGITDTATLRMASELCGTASFTERQRGFAYGPYWHRRHQRYRIWHEVMGLHMIRQLPRGHAMIVRGTCAPVVARLSAAWNDRRYKRCRRRSQAIAAWSEAPAQPPEPPQPPQRPEPPQPPPAHPDSPTPPPDRPHLTLVPGCASDDEPISTGSGYPWSYRDARA